MKVKSLEWIVRGKSHGPVVYAGAFGVTLFYSISGTEGDWTLSYPGSDCMIHVDGFGTQHSAREAAQVDYVTRASDAIETDANPAPSSPINGEPVRLTYTNWRGETSERTIKPIRIYWGSTEWHPEPQWLLMAFDIERSAERDFALKDFGRTPSPKTHSVGSECQYSNDVGMPEHRCAVRYQCEIEAETLVKAERKRCLDVVDQYYGGGRSFVMRKISDAALATEGK